MIQAKAFFLLTVCITLCFFGQAQELSMKKANTVFVNDSVTSFSQSDIFLFPYVNKVSFYYDPERLNQIKQLDAAHNEKEMYAALRDYVKHFGVRNFSRNVPMIWRLAHLSEKYGPKGEAILLYKLVLKHHVQGINIKGTYAKYDSISTDRKEDYVPLDKYYQLVEYRKEIDTLRPPHSVLVSMGDSVNSKYEDYGPAIGNVDDIMLFSSKRNRTKHTAKRAYNEDIFFSKKIDSTWVKAKSFETINTDYNEGSACLSPDGNFLFFSRCGAPGGLGNCDLYVAKLKPNGTWGMIKNLGEEVNSTGWESHPAVNHTGDTLYFASNRAGGMGNLDIYFSVKDKKGKWGKAQNAGPIINTVRNEVSPFYHHRYNVLYFSSDGQPLNFGGFDIYKSYRQNNVWGEPKNVGPLVNGAGDEYYFTIDSKSENLYYAKSNEDDKKNLDLYSFPLPMEAHPDAVASLHGEVKDKKGNAVKGIVAVIDLDKGVEVSPKYLREDGSYDFSLINKRNYLVIIQGDDFFRIEEVFFMDGNMRATHIVEQIESKIAFQSLEFENGKSDILEQMHNDLAKLGNYLTDHPKENLTISGHTDSDGNEDSNLKLSQARADAIKNYLIEQFKIEDARIKAIGYGSSKPIVEESSDRAKQVNRRVEFELRKE